MTSWHRRAACAGLPLELFFGGEEDRARQVCSSCPVRIDCLIDAIRNGEYGFWGGMTENERKRKRRRDNRTRQKTATT